MEIQERFCANWGLSAKALALVSEFALLMYYHDRTVINVDANDVIQKVSCCARRCKDDNIRSVYLRLKAELNSLKKEHMHNQRAASLRSQIKKIAARTAAHG